MVVAYARPFQGGNFALSRLKDKPADAALGELHDHLAGSWRNTVYAHTVKTGGRTVAIVPRSDRLGLAIQRKRFEDEAESLSSCSTVSWCCVRSREQPSLGEFGCVWIRGLRRVKVPLGRRALR